MKKFIYIASSLLIGVIIGMTATATAAPVKEYVQASFEKITFIVNGEKTPLDADPLVYQGSTYLPVRTVLNALGYDVGYKADSKTVTADKANSLLPAKGEQADMTLTNSQDVEKQVESLNKSLTAEKETVESIKQLIQETEKRTDVSEELKKQKIDGYNERIELSEKMIRFYEEKITELQN